VLEAVTRQFGLTPIAAPHHPLLSNHRLGNAPLAEQGVPCAAVQPVLLTIKGLVDQPAHARRKRTDGQIKAVILHAKLQFVGAHHRQMQMHRRVLLAIGANGLGKGQGLVADRGVDNPQVQSAAQLTLECCGVLFKTFQLTQQAQSFLVKQLALAGKAEPASPAMAQHKAQNGFELAHIGADGRGREV